jgi:hypothetical protein
MNPHNTLLGGTNDLRAAGADARELLLLVDSAPASRASPADSAAIVNLGVSGRLKLGGAPTSRAAAKVGIGTVVILCIFTESVADVAAPIVVRPWHESAAIRWRGWAS